MYFNTEHKPEADSLLDQVLADIEAKAIVKYERYKATRTNKQSASRWKYLQMCADILNERGWLFKAPGSEIHVPFTKDLLYQVYWQAVRMTMFPGKTKQLNTKEFSELVEEVLRNFAEIFAITISFPSRNNQEFESITEEDE